MPGNYTSVIVWITWFCRILCGGLFIFSGFVKAIDPWGTLFKIEEYLMAFGIGLPFALIRLIVFALCAVEFVVGCFLLTGCYRKSCPVFALLIMIFMLPFTLWLAVENPVTDCGCFGDAIQVSNWFTFGKNIVITGGVVWLVRYNISALCLITPAFQWLAVVFSGIFIVVIELIGFFYQPLMDFRNYKEGSPLFYSEANEEGLDVFDITTGDDRTEVATVPEGKELVVMIPKVSMVSPATTWKLNALYEWCLEHGVTMIGVVSGSEEEIHQWKDLSMAAYPLYLADDTSIKEVVRGNPGIVYLDNGKIQWKSTLAAIDTDEITSSDNETDLQIYYRDNRLILNNISLAYLIVMIFLVFISFTPKLARLLVKGGLASKRGVRHH